MTQDTQVPEQDEEQQEPEILLLHLITNQLLVGLVTFTDQGYKVEKPLVIAMVPNQAGRAEPRLVPFGGLPGLIPALEEVELMTYHVLLPRECPDGIRDTYNQAVSGIVTARTMPPEARPSIILGG